MNEEDSYTGLCLAYRGGLLLSRPLDVCAKSIARAADNRPAWRYSRGGDRDRLKHPDFRRSRSEPGH